MLSLHSLFIAGMLLLNFLYSLQSCFYCIFYINSSHAFIVFLFYSCQALITILIFTASMLSLHSLYFIAGKLSLYYLYLLLLGFFLHFIFYSYYALSVFDLLIAVLLTISVLPINLFILSGL